MSFDTTSGCYEKQTLWQKTLSNTLILKETVDTAVANAVGPLNKKLAEMDVLVPRVIELEKKIFDRESD